MDFDSMRTKEKAQREYRRIEEGYAAMGVGTRRLTADEIRQLDAYLAELLQVISSPAVQEETRWVGKTPGTLWYRAVRLHDEIRRYQGANEG